MTSTGGFQTQVTVQPPIGVAGDFASANPRFTVLAGQGALAAGPDGVYVGRFCWGAPPLDNDNANALVNPYGSGPVLGFVGRSMQALITGYLNIATMLIPRGFGVTVFSGGDFLVVNDGATIAQVGMKAYANVADGKVTFAATGAPTGGASATASTITPETNSFTGAIDGDLLTAAGAVTGTIYPGTTISGTGVASGTKVVSQLTPLLAGEALGGDGRYYVSIPAQSVASTAISGTYGLLTIGTATGVFAVNDLLTVSGSVVAGTRVTANVTGAGGTGGTMVVDNNTNVGSQTISVAAVNVETKWIAMSAGAAGDTIKISDHPLG